MDGLAPWQWIVQLGRNSSTYKLALAQELLELARNGQDVVPMDDLAQRFQDAYRERVLVKKRPQQPIQGRWTVVERSILQSTPDSLVKVREDALRNMVLQKFHNLEGDVSAPRFFEDPGNGSSLRLTPLMMRLAEDDVPELRAEVTSRWDLTEHAFTASNPEAIEANAALASVQTVENRVSLTHLVPALSGYQRHACFYCSGPLDSVAVDHFLPFSYVRHNELWNLVLTDADCNGNKSDQLPMPSMIDRLVDRNEVFIKSANPLRSTLVARLGPTPRAREAFVRHEYARWARVGRVWGGGRPDAETMLREYMRYVREKTLPQGRA